MKMIKQQFKRDCGQCCVAMLTESTYEQAVEAVGHAHSTKTKDLVRAINKLGWECGPNRLKVFKFRVAGPLMLKGLVRALVKISWPGRSSWHWIAVINGRVYDPDLRFPDGMGVASSWLGIWQR